MEGVDLGMGIAELEGVKELIEDALVEQLSESIRKSDMGVTKPAREVSRSMRDRLYTIVKLEQSRKSVREEGDIDYRRG